MALLPENTYQGKIIDWELISSSKGTPGIEFTTRLTHVEDEEDGELVELEAPVKKRMTFWLSANRIDWTLSDLRKVGYTRKDIEGLDPGSPDAFNFAGRDIRVAVTHDEYNGKPKEDFKLEKIKADKEVQQGVFESLKVAAQAAKEKEEERQRQLAELESPPGDFDGLPDEEDDIDADELASAEADQQWK